MVGLGCWAGEFSFWCEITSDKRTEVYHNHESRVTYSSSGSKATSICNPLFGAFIGLSHALVLPDMRSKGAPV